MLYKNKPDKSSDLSGFSFNLIKSVLETHEQAES